MYFSKFIHTKNHRMWTDLITFQISFINWDSSWIRVHPKSDNQCHLKGHINKVKYRHIHIDTHIKDFAKLDTRVLSQ